MINKNNDVVHLDKSKAYVMLLTYGRQIGGWPVITAPLVRLATGQLANHAALLIYELGQWVAFESREQGVTKEAAQKTIVRKGIKHIRIMEYTGGEPVDYVLAAANVYHSAGVKYDTANLVWHQLIYRITKTIAHNTNCFIGEEKYKGIWIGKTGEGAKGRLQCFEFIYCAFGLPLWWLASGAEFAKLADFQKEVYRD